MKRGLIRTCLTLGVAAASIPASAQAIGQGAASGRISVSDGGDTALLIACAMLAMLAVPGTALMQAGLVRLTNLVSVVVQPLVVSLIVMLLWVIVGYTLAFGTVTSGWIGAGNAWMLARLGNVRADTAVPESAFALFQIVIATLPCALLTGTWAGRARFGWVVVFCALWGIVVLAPLEHWIWGGGWITGSLGTLDWGGGLVLRVSAGVSALTAAVLLGRGRTRPAGAVNTPLGLLAPFGAMLTSLATIAICCGWAMVASDDASAAALAALTGTVAGALAWIAADAIARRPVSGGALARAMLAGGASISAAAGYVSPGGAIVIGVIGGGIGCLADRAISRSAIDDRLGVFAANGVPGAIGALLVGPLISPVAGGTGYAPGRDGLWQTLAQAQGLIAVCAWSLVMTTILAVMASVVFAMRVDEDVENRGLDPFHHTLPDRQAAKPDAGRKQG